MQSDHQRYHQQSLPSIQTIFEGISISEEKQSSIGCRRHAFELVNFQPVGPVEPNIDADLTSKNEIMTTPADRDSATTASHISNSFITHYTHPTSLHYYQRSLSPRRSPRNLHSRSFSDYTHPYPTFSPPHHSSSRLAPLHPQQQQTNNNTFHRRAISTTTLDLKLQPILKQPVDCSHGTANPTLPSLYASSSTTTNAHSAPQSPSSVTTHQDYLADAYQQPLSDNPKLDHHHHHHHHHHQQQQQQQHQQHHQQQQQSYPVAAATATATSFPFKKIEPKPLSECQDPVIVTAESTGNNITSVFNLSTRKKKDSDINLSSNNNKYKCPYCLKGFSRPSSVRIHIYSHTGERPFECPYDGCFRKFSVQSNMRRHMKIHSSSVSNNSNGNSNNRRNNAKLKQYQQPVKNVTKEKEEEEEETYSNTTFSIVRHDAGHRYSSKYSKPSLPSISQITIDSLSPLS